MLDRILSVWAAITGGGSGSKAWLTVVGLCCIFAGVMMFVWPRLAALVLRLSIAAQALNVGIFEIVGAIRRRKEISHERMLILSGAVSVSFGIALLTQSAADAQTVIWLIGCFSILFGALYITCALRFLK